MRNVYFSQGTKSEQYLIEDLIIESIQIYGQDFFYIPRTLVSKDEILGEDRLSEFKSSFPIEAYFENVEGFEGGGAFASKFGLMMEQSATLVVARRRWEQLVGRYGQTIIPSRPCEGDLMYFPLTGGLFEIKFVAHQDPFYQLGKLYVYKLDIELFQYASERLNTGIPDIDIFESLKTFSTDPEVSSFGVVKSVSINNKGVGYASAPNATIISDTGVGAIVTTNLGTGINSDKVISVNIINGGSGYTDATTISFSGGGGSGATGTVQVVVDIDQVGNYGTNNSFKNTENVIWNESNPFGEIE